MISPDKIFENYFNDKNIINTRLDSFASDCIARLTSGNTGSRFDAILTLLNSSYPAFSGNISNLDVALTLQKGGTMNVEGTMTLFKKTMSEQEPFIASALGGRATTAYLQFYPHKVTEYTIARQTEMNALTQRVKTAASTNATALGTTLAALLQGFKAQWTTAKSNQMTQKGNVSTKRDDRDTTRTTLELNLCSAIHTVGGLFPGDIPTSMSFFSFHLLFNSTRHHHVVKSGSIAPGAKVVIFNELFEDTQLINVRNTTTNANIIAYFGEHDTDEPLTGEGIIVNNGKDKNEMAPAYGKNSFPFFILKNLSSVNEATYVVEITE